MSHYSETFNQGIHTMCFVKRELAKTSVGCIQGMSLCLRNCFLFFLQRTRPIHYCRSKTHVSGSFRLQNCLLFSSNDTSFRNGSGTSTKWPETRVLDVKYVVRNQVDVLEHRNGVKIPKIWVLDLNECIEIFQVVSLESYYSETFNQMHLDTSFCNRSGASMKWRKTPKTWVLDLK